MSKQSPSPDTRSISMPDAANTSRFRRYFFLGLLCLLPAAFFVYQAWFNPRIEFLVPSFKARWILHSPDKLFPDTLSGTVLFRRRFQLWAVPKECILTIRAASQFSLSVNGHMVEPDSQRVPHNWKSARSYDIAPFLLTPDNSIMIRVTNDHGPPALLVETPAWSLPARKITLSSNTDWESAFEPDFARWRRCVLTNQDPPVLGDELSPVQKSSRYPIYMMLFGAYSLFVLLAANPWHLFYRPPVGARPSYDEHHENLPGKQASSTRLFSVFISSQGLRTIVFLVVILGVLLINFHNVAVYPYSRSYFDWEGHVAYIKYVASHWRVPLPTQGWEMYQPPLYYFLSAILYNVCGGETGEPASLKAVQVLGTLSGLACILLAWLSLRLVCTNNRGAQLLGFSTVAFLPMTLYMNPTISNEVFCAAIISWAIYLLMRYGFLPRISFKQAVMLGAVVGLAMLSKYTGFLAFLIAAGVLALRLWIRSGHRRHEAAILAVFAVTVFSLCGWFYVRNAVIFHNPFVGNWNKETGFHFEQPPGYRTLGFYSRFGSVFMHAPERSRWLSFWDGYYGSMWADPHFNMLDYRNGKANSHASIILWLALLPSVAMIVGFVKSLKAIPANRRFEPDFALVMAGIITMLALIWYTMEIPFITTIKAFYSLSLLPAFAVFSGIGLYQMANNLRKFAPLLYISLTALFVLIGRLYWYSGN